MCTESMKSIFAKILRKRAVFQILKKINYLFRVEISFENGLFLNLEYKITERYRKFVESKLKIYENLDEYIRDYTDKSDLQLANFRTIFQCLCYLYVLIILIFVLSLIYRRRRVIKKLFKKLIRKLLRTFHTYIVIMLNKISRYLSDSEN